MIKINIIPSLLVKLDLLSSEYETEIGGYLIGETVNGELVINDILLPDQSVSYASVNINTKDQVNLLRRYGSEKCKKIVGHWHSHAKMGCFWSAQDKFNMDNIMMYKDYFIFVVSSNKEHLCRLCIRKPITLDFEQVLLNIKSLSIDMFKNHVKKILDVNKQNLQENSKKLVEENGVSRQEEISINDEQYQKNNKEQYYG